MKKIGLAIAAAAAGLALTASAATAGLATTATVEGSPTLVHKTGGSVYIDLGGPRYGGYDGYYYDRPYYRSYGYYAPRRYYGYDGYRPYKYSRRWTKERFEHPLGRR